ncbi:ArsR/SmtB family transcription factor [Diaminobutyricibacter sp. McL0608]|uniref:ArsR/SmtB family transcription factor n=1 Tax=Leifsonia sp. McL0608 TaxID=3143537 RepID=UPI0031F31DB0
MTGILEPLDLPPGYILVSAGRTRVEILRMLSHLPNCTTSHVMAELGLTRNGVLAHLKTLAAAGLISRHRSTHPRGSGRTYYWRANQEMVSDALDDLYDYILGT